MKTLLPSRRRDTQASFSERAVERLQQAVAPSKVDRRGFLYRAALTGTAIAVNPFDFAFKPGTAYASVCGQGSSCSSGWTAFCCTINNGANMCPPGSYVAGWWRIDDSAFCRGSARYIIDCNRRPGSSCNCRCASGTCDQRRVCCNNFRYGQCNQQIAGVTEVVCRVVTCTAPWQWDPSCTRTVRVDNRTATHSAPCLPGHNPSHIQMKYQDLGLSGAPVGRPSGGERSGANGGRVQRYTNGYITYRAAVGAWSVHGALATAYAEAGLEAGPLGYVTSDREHVGDRRGQRHRFEHGQVIHSSATGAIPVFGNTWQAYAAAGGPRGVLGYPTHTRRFLGNTQQHQQIFERGRIYATNVAATPIVVHGAFWNQYLALGGPSGPLGRPARDQGAAAGGGQQQLFEHGAIYSSPSTRPFGVTGANFTRYSATGSGRGPLGWPTGREGPVADGRGRVQRFQNGYILSTPTTGTWELAGDWYTRYAAAGGPRGPMRYPTGPVETAGAGQRQRTEQGGLYRHSSFGTHAVHTDIHDRYLSEGGPTGPLGFPRSGHETLSNGTQRVRFQNGTINRDPVTGQTTVHWR